MVPTSAVRSIVPSPLVRLPLRAVALALVLAGCGDDTGPTGSVHTGGDIGFSPTNVVAVGSASAPLVLSGTCTVDTDSGTISCADGAYGFELATQSDGSTPIAIFRTGDLTIEAASEVSIVGSNPVAFVSFGTIRVQGYLYAGPNPFVNGGGRAGGFSPTTTPFADGNGPGGGDAGSDGVGGGGGAYCGRGGGTNGGLPYGNNVIDPLRGGSSGGNGVVGTAGAGGGAIQLVARDGIEILYSGVVHAGGAGGNFGGAPTEQPGAGGGSGGAILLEAPSVTIDGYVAANGGGGGGVGAGSIPQPGSYASYSGSGVCGGEPNGGCGAGGASADGLPGSDHAGSGGGVGWIRINTTAGAAAVTGVVSPDFSTGCATQGTLGP